MQAGSCSLRAIRKFRDSGSLPECLAILAATCVGGLEMETSHTGSSGHESAFGLPGESGADDAMRGNRQNEPEQRPGTYILAPQVGLRSYDRLPFAYCIKGQAKPKLLDAAGFAIACKCDGSTPFPESDALRRLVEQGVAVPCEPGSVQLSGFQRLRVFPNRVIPWIAL